MTRVTPTGAFGEAAETRCHHCKRPVPAVSLVTRGEEWEDGGQQGFEEVEVCIPCAAKMAEAAAYEEYLADPFNRAYEAARANGWRD